jgi:hypothetical protein
MNPFWFFACLFNFIFDIKIVPTKMNYEIVTTWDNKSIKHSPVKFTFSCNDENSLKIDVIAPFFNSPARPNQKPGKLSIIYNFISFNNRIFQ